MTKDQATRMTFLILQACEKVREIREEFNGEEVYQDLVNCAIDDADDVLTDVMKEWKEILEYEEEHSSEEEVIESIKWKD